MREQFRAVAANSGLWVILVSLLALGQAVAPAPLAAQDPASMDPRLTLRPSAWQATADGEGSDGQPELDWRWRRVGAGQHVLSGALLTGTLALTLSDPDLDLSWVRELLFHDVSGYRLDADGDRAANAAGAVGDALMYSLVAYPLVVEAGVLAWGLRRSPDVAWQMLSIDSQAFLITGLVTQLTKLVERRREPEAQQCDPYDPQCAAQEPESLFSGQTATAFTGAGLVCAHATNMPGLYGSAAAGQAACLSALAAATAVGALRVVAEERFSSDVLLGAATGMLVGYFLPQWFHYDREEPEPPRVDPEPLFPGDLGGDRHRSERPEPTHMLTPMVSQESIGLSYTLTW